MEARRTAPASRAAITPAEEQSLIKLREEMSFTSGSSILEGWIDLGSASDWKLFVEDGDSASMITLPLSGGDTAMLHRVAASSAAKGPEGASELKDVGQLVAHLRKLELLPSKGVSLTAFQDTELGGGQDRVGTLLINLPSPHNGGDLVVHHSGGDRVFSTEPTSSGSSKRVSWIFINTGATHEVRPVTSGTRLTLVYDIFSSTSSLPSPPLPISTSNTPFQTKLGSLLKSPDFLPAGGRLAIALAHAYPVERLSSGTASRDNDKYTKDLPGRLVGIDAIVYATSADLGIPVDFRAVYEEQARAVFRSAALEAPWWDETAVFNSEDDKEEAFMEACIDNVYGPILDDDYIPIDAFASRSVARVPSRVISSRWGGPGPEENDYILTGDYFMGEKSVGDDFASEWENVLEGTGATIEADLVWLSRPGPEAWTTASTHHVCWKRADRRVKGAVAAVLQIPAWGQGIRSKAIEE